MSDTIKIAPVLCRGDFLDEAQKSAVSDLLKVGRAEDVQSILLHLTSYEETGLDILAGPHIAIAASPGCDLLNLRDERIPKSLKEYVKRAALQLVGDQDIRIDLEAIDEENILFYNRGYYSVYLFPGCSIVCADDPVSHLMVNKDQFHKAPQNLSRRAPTCTIILGEVKTAHERIEQVVQVSRALGVWRLMTGISAPGTVHETKITLMDPTADQITSCEREVISNVVDDLAA